MSTKHRCALIALVTSLALGATLQSAEAGPGFRVGLTDDPDALTIGFQYGIPIARASSGYFVFEPAVDFGVVEGPIDFMIRGTFHFKFLLPLNREVVVYPLIGPALAYTSADAGDDTGFGLDLGAGFGWSAFSVEFWAGFDDIPDLTLMFAFRF